MIVFAGTESPEELIALAWALEEGSRTFYASLADRLQDREAAAFFEKLVLAEQSHKRTLVQLYGEITGKESSAALSEREDLRDIMEGGVGISEALEWAQDKEAADVLQYAMSLEINAYDLYLKMVKRFEGEPPSAIFDTLAKEEEAHLNRMGELLGKRT
jgi:rubrerythrin